MKAQNLYKYLVIGLITLLLAACSNTDAEQKFDQTPTERLNAQKDELNNLLLSSGYGWKLVYFTDNTILGGYTHLIKFAKDGTVEMASDFDDDTAIYKSEYEIQLGSTLSLVFTTANRIHLLSESDNYPIEELKSKGYLGDFQFLYYGQENGEIIFRTNRVNTTTKTNPELRFVKATAEDWTDLHKNIDMIDNVIGAPTRPLFRSLETNDGKTIHQFDFSFSEITRFAEANSLEAGYSVAYNMGIGYSPTGIVVSPVVEVGGQKLSIFTYNDTDGSFTATGTNGVSATIKYSTTPPILTDDYKQLLEGQPQSVYGYIAAYLYSAPSTSQYCKDLLDKANATLPANQQISRIQFHFNTPYGTYIEYRFTGGKASLYHTVTTSEDADKKTMILTNVYWDDGSAIIDTPPFLKEIDDELTNPNGLYVKKETFKVRYPNTIWTFSSTSSNFRLTTYDLN
ncbi:DUF4302 domain-containing protein [Flavobacterium sp. 5]|uniref:DUF4302 domain-containing protein n=1 Tax=Flavobacterium sp. 5 TaxID=2035199 RepID=UPI000C2C31EE|nr:DUF4302 domain-containing protein [Flavobacterium sp. 5]PKB17783.1 uncharacterized protein DUF4302 [Flavobacterium sp. 5]